MSERDFDLRLQRVLNADAERAVRPFDAVAVAEASMAAAPAPRRLEWRPAGWPVIRLVVIATLLLLAAVATLWIVAVGAPHRQGIVDVVPSERPSGQPLNAELTGSWIAPAPADLRIGGSSVQDPFTLRIDAGRELYLPNGHARERFPAAVAAVGADELQLTTRPGPAQDVQTGGQLLAGCTAGDVGTYRVIRSADGLLLTLRVVADACPSRPAVFARTWWRYLGLPSSGGIGVVDAFEPAFAVTLPPGGYEADEVPGSIDLHQPAAEFEFNAWKDPQGFNDPCDPLGKGRRPIANAADFVAYFRQLPGFTVDSVADVRIDGRPATHLTLHANVDASCPAGWLVQWQPAEITGQPYWYLRPGDSDSLFLVDLADSTLMFEVLPRPEPFEAQVIASIRLLENGLATSP
jgi:hypothetical protein